MDRPDESYSASGLRLSPWRSQASRSPPARIVVRLKVRVSDPAGKGLAALADRVGLVGLVDRWGADAEGPADPASDR